MEILAIAGSLRIQSSNAALVRAIAQLTSQNTTLKIYDGLGNLPPFSPDIDTEPPPQPVSHLRSKISNADAVLICTPEYAYGMPGVLKNALDWLVSSGSLYQKPVAALSASPSDRGGDRALTWLLQTLTALVATVPGQSLICNSIYKREISE
ncbi:MAG: flavoprotein [Leptolyngbya foveolarum]|uniref:Flavoprotein n=1 Tax=Leptolyngbya foveolarum TaxID=47253 RepID=A0A2W4U761_9CYAN|nr:MAG: flavoprotein [Leptolyngbya foveolarum]